MNVLKKCTAALLSMIMLLSFFGCGEGTANVMKVDGMEIRAGIYIYYSIDAYFDALKILAESENFNYASYKTDKELKKAIKGKMVEGLPIQEWIQNKATEYCLQYVAIEKEFERLNLTVSEDTKSEIDTYYASSWAYLGDFYTASGIGEQTVKDVLLSGEKRTAIYKAYYGEGGSEGVTDESLRTYYKENNARVEYVKIPLTDGEGNLLKSDGKAKLKEMAEQYLDRIKAQSTEESMLHEFDNVIDEYKEYATSVSNAAVTTTDESGNLITTATTVKTTTVTTTTVTTTDIEDTDQDEDADQTEETTVVPSVTTTTTAPATSGSGDASETTTTTKPYPNESIIAKMTTAPESEKKDEGTTTTTEIKYTPSEKTYNFIFNDAKLGVPELIEEDEALYIVVRLNIEDRMTADDLWSESNVESVRQTIYGDAFDAKVEEWAKGYTEERDSAAYRRYDPLDLDIITYYNAIMKSYSSYYGG